MARNRKSNDGFAIKARLLLLWTVILLSLSSRQAWAVIICICEHENKSEIEYCHCNHHISQSTDLRRHVGSHDHSPAALHDHVRHSERFPGHQLQRDDNPILAEGGEIAAKCSSRNCKPEPQAVTPAVSLPIQEQWLTENDPPLGYSGRSAVAIPKEGFATLSPSRPLYISLSCLLI